jgi:hypothetical protein
VQRHEELLREWSEDGLQSLREMLPLMSPLGAHSFETPTQRHTLFELASATARTAESAMLLCAYGQLWDAELLVRATVEGSLKFCYLLQSRDTFSARHREFAEDLFDIALQRDHHKVAPFLAGIGEDQEPTPTVRPLHDRLLSAEQLDNISRRIPRKVRSSIGGRWGFTGLLSALAESGDPLFASLGSTAFGYAMASHIMHADPIGCLMPLERDHRSSEAATAAHLVHAARLILDCTQFHRLRLTTSCRFVDADMTPLAKADEIVAAAEDRHRKAYDTFYAIEYPDDPSCSAAKRWNT